MQDLLTTIKDLGFLNGEELDYIEGILRSEPFPKTAKELGKLIREARKYGEKEKET